MKPKPEKKPETGPGDQGADFEKSPDMIALDAVVRGVLKAQKDEICRREPEAVCRLKPAHP